MGFWEKVKGFMVSPTATFNGVRDEGWGTSFSYFAKLLVIFAVLMAVIVALIAWVAFAVFFGMFGAILAAFGVPADAMTGAMGWVTGLAGLTAVILLIFVIISGLIGILVGSGWMHIWVYICGGRKGVGQTIKAMAYGSTPSLVLGWIPFIGIIFSIWSIVVSIIGIRQLHEISTGRAVLAYLLGAIIIPAIAMIIIRLI
jgi:hypothetical protein